jgi:hypothetical protein
MKTTSLKRGLFASKQALVSILLILSAGAAQAEGSNWRFFGGLGLADGGDIISRGIIVQDGTNKELPFEIKAGGGTQYRAGVEYRLMERLSVQGSIGVSVADPMGYNGSLTFSTVPVEVMAFVNITEGARIGFGVRKTNARMAGTGVAANWPELGTYDSNGGTVLEAQYLFGNASARAGTERTQFGISLRVVDEKFTHTTVTVGGKHYEVGGIVYF